MELLPFYRCWASYTKCDTGDTAEQGSIQYCGTRIYDVLMRKPFTVGVDTIWNDGGMELHTVA